MSSEFQFLVVDDLSPVRRAVVNLLKALGYDKVSEAENGEKALELLQAPSLLKGPINFVITDWHMPVMNGITLLRAIRSMSGLQELPVLMITAETDDDNLLFATKAGIDGYILKPLLRAALLKRMVDSILVKRGKARTEATCKEQG